MEENKEEQIKELQGKIALLKAVWEHYLQDYE